MMLQRSEDHVPGSRRCRRLAGIMMSLLMLALPRAVPAAATPAGPLFAPPEAAAPAEPVALPTRLPSATDKAVSTVVNWEYVPGLDFSQLGAAVGTVGDLNGDGFGDAAIGAPNMRDPGSSRVGAVLIFHGSATGLPAAPSVILYGPHYASNYVEFGAALSPAGDVNGDGFGDLLVGAPGYGGDGAAFVYLGSAGGIQTAYAWSWTIDDFTGGSARLGTAVSTAGDVDGDGYDDILVGTPLAYSGFRGRAALFRGGPGGLAAAPSWDVTGAAVGDRFGSGLAAAGDVNADGYDDVVVGVPGATGIYPPFWDTYYGQVSVYHGGATGLALAPANVIYGTQLNAGFGAAVSGAGDMNGDGFADIGVGAPTWDSAWAVDGGRALALPGSAGGIFGAPLWEEFGSIANDRFGAVLAPGGDVNGDGLGDLLVGSSNVSNGGSGHGFAAVVTGSRVGSIFMPWYRYDAGNVLFGGAVGTAGDVDGDGFSDILVGSSGYTGTLTLEGRVQMFRGAADAPAPSAGSMASSGISGSFFGWVVAAAGDVNGDGYDDMLATAPNASVQVANDGLVVLFLGDSGGVSSQASWYAIGPYANCGFGSSAACAGDVNGDGYDDIAIGAQDLGNEGFVQLWYGSPYGPRAGAPDWATDGFQADSRFGSSVASAGDVNGDGYADLIVGAPGDDTEFAGQTRPANEGRAYLYLGSPTGLGETVWSALGGQLDGGLGNSVAGAGDVNGDGYGDVIIGMEAYDRPLSPGFSIADEGRAYVYHGNSGGLGAVPATTLSGSGNANFGHVVGTAGDVDGDGFSDVIVSAIYGDPNDQGLVAVYRGSAGGVATGAHWSFSAGQAFAEFGSWVGTAGDVNGDGLSDVVFGAQFHEGTGPQDSGSVWVFAGPLTGTAGTTALRQWSGTQAYENLGRCAVGVGDLNGDGFADIGAGSAGYTGSVYKEGRTQVWYGNNRYQAWDTVPRRAQQLRTDGTTPIGLGGLANAGSNFKLQAWTGSAAGRTDVRLEWQIAAYGTPLGGPVTRGTWTDSAPYGAGTTINMVSPPIEVPGGEQGHWRLRVASRSPYFPHSPWQSPSRNGRQEADLRLASWLSGVDDGDAVPGFLAARLVAAPNPFNPRTQLSFDLRRDGLVRIELFDLAGRRVAVLLDEVRPAGRVEVVWDGRDDSGRGCASGTYFARAEGGGESATAKLTLIR